MHDKLLRIRGQLSRVVSFFLRKIMPVLLAIVLVFVCSVQGFFIKNEKVNATVLPLIETALMGAAIGLILTAYGLGFATKEAKDTAIESCKTFLSEQIGWDNPQNYMSLKLVWCAASLSWQVQVMFTDMAKEAIHNWINATYNVGINEVTAPTIDFHQLPYDDYTFVNVGDKFALPRLQACYYFTSPQAGAPLLFAIPLISNAPYQPYYALGDWTFPVGMDFALRYASDGFIHLESMVGYTNNKVLYLSDTPIRVYGGDVAPSKILGIGEAGVLDNPALTWECPNTLYIPMVAGMPTDAGVVIGDKTFVIDDVATDVVGHTGTQTREAVDVATSTVIDGSIPWDEVQTTTGESPVGIPAENPMTDVVSIGPIDQDRFEAIKAIMLSRFPFCLPWDFVTVIGLFNAPAKCPRFLFTIPLGNYEMLQDIEFDADFSKIPNFDKMASLVRWTVLISFILFLIFVTRNLIRS